VRIRVLSLFPETVKVNWRMNYPLYPETLFARRSVKSHLESEGHHFFPLVDKPFPNSPSGIFGRPRPCGDTSIVALELEGFFGIYDLV
jgi:hypothetical protein